MFNNEITYHEKWYTQDNIKASKTLQPYLNRCECSSDVPLSWTKEVLDLLATLDKNLGIERNSSTIEGYYVAGNLYHWLIKKPMVGLVKSIKFIYKEGWDDFHSAQQKINYVIRGFITNIRHGMNSATTVLINPVLNRLFKPKVKLLQVKEKYGTLRVYYSADEQYTEYIDNLIRKTEVKLAIKGAYLDIETLWNSTVTYSMGTEYNPELIEVTKKKDSISITETKYRKIIKDLGIDTSKFETQKVK